ncbi:flavodoxin [Stutzerimonas xanthomarina]|uniref:flavodoxin n=1 Tax=Stutzerimonas xanthomarina TaxID=271420 RepID=UPI003AA85F7F
MNRVLLLTSLAATLLTPIQAVAETEDKKRVSDSSRSNKVLTVYLSRTKNTKAVADMIHDHVGGDLVALELQTPYPEDYDSIVAQVDEENESGYRPPLATSIDNLAQYGTVFIGFPTWDMQLPPPIKSFLNQHELAGKTVVPFNTHGGYGAGSSFQTLTELCSGCNLLEGFSTRGGLERDGIFLAIDGERKAQVKEDVLGWMRSLELDRQP